MSNAKRGRGSRRGIAFCAAAALGLALSACGGSGSSASDPQADSSLPTASAGAVTIDWTPPTQNTNGSALTNLAGYDINYGSSSGDYTQTITVANPGIARYVVDNLTPGTYYFSLTAYNSDGTKSPPSPEVSATVN
jgi:hypothetical protein